jgi:Uma2 family endonuclease
VTAQEYEHQGPWTVPDLLKMPDSGNKLELIDGALIVSPPPAGRHQRVLHRLQNLLEYWAPDREMWQSVGVQLAAHLYGDRMLVPDLTVVKDGAADPAPVLDAKDVLLVVEVVSPGSRAMDRVGKPALYAESGIPYYWRIELDPYRGNSLPLPMVVAASLGGPLDEDVRYVVQAEVGAGSRLELEWPFPVSFDPAELVR